MPALSLTSPPTLRHRAPGKLNLTLDILGRRDDGFHALRSLVVGVDLHDEISVRANPAGAGVTFTCNDDMLTTRDNLVVRAAELLARELDRPADVHIDLVKKIPVGGGMGGGSSDAASTLLLLNHLWQTSLPAGKLASLGSRLGSDTPLFFSLPSALITGRGERVSPLPLAFAGWALLVFVGVHVSTPAVYRQWHREAVAGFPSDQATAIAACTGAADIMALCSNHLEPAVFRVAPAVHQKKQELEAFGIRPLRVSGAGSVLFSLFDDKTQADAAQALAATDMNETMQVVRVPVDADPVSQGDG